MSSSKSFTPLLFSSLHNLLPLPPLSSTHDYSSPCCSILTQKNQKKEGKNSNLEIKLGGCIGS